MKTLAEQVTLAESLVGRTVKCGYATYDDEVVATDIGITSRSNTSNPLVERYFKENPNEEYKP